MSDKKIIVISGMPRSGKTSLSEGLSRTIPIVFPPTEFSFFRYFSEDKFIKRGGFRENLAYFISTCPKSKQWNLTLDMIRDKGHSARDLYIILLMAFKDRYSPDKTYIGELTPFCEQHFYTLLEWFGEERVRMIQIVRDPYLNFASYKKQNMKKDKSTNYIEKLLFTFCYSWAQSIAFGYYLERKYSQSFTTVYLDEYLNNSGRSLDVLIKWLGIKDKDTIGQRKPINEHHNTKECESLMALLSNYEKSVIEGMSCLDFLECTHYSNKSLFLDFKDIPPSHEKRHLLSKSLLISKMGLLIEENSLIAIMKYGYHHQKQILSILGRKIYLMIFGKLKN